MFHPLIQDLTKLKDEDLEGQISNLNKKIGIALRMGNGGIAQQLNVILFEVREELLRRQREAKGKLQVQNKDLDDLINVG